MKRSPTSSCSSSSSSYIIGTKSDINVTVPRRTRAKRPREANNEPGSAKRSSIYRGVTRHRWTGRYEAHLWDKNTWNSIQNKKGRQIYLGAYDSEDAAARTYDLAALKYWGQATNLNFPIETYTKEVEEMGKVSKEEYLASLRRRSSGFSRGVSKYRGVARHHHNGRWEARIGRVLGNKYMYLGTYGTQEEAAAAYDLAAIEFRGAAAITNFDISTYADKLKQMQQPQSRGVRVKEAQKDEKNADQDQAEKQGGADQKTEPIGSTLMLDPSEEPWNFCLDVGLLPDVPFDKSAELPDLFSGTGFEEDIDFMFDDELKVESAPYGAKEGTTSSSSSSTITSSALAAAS